MKYVIEHMEPSLFKWCEIEYRNISKIVGKENLIFTNIKARDYKKLEKYGKVYSKSAAELGLELKRTCLLDQSAEKELSKDDSKRFDYMVFGGILGDFPRKERTGKLNEKLVCEKRHLGNEQFSTDNAVLVTSLILKGKRLQDINFQDGIEIDTNKGESVCFPFRYILVKGKPFISEELVKFLKKRKGF
jgi:ribosome biogenesis SPOUT family RNA methylase Rps3